MVGLAKAIGTLASALFAYAGASKSRHTRAALHIAVRIKHLYEVVGMLGKDPDFNSKSIKKIAAIKRKIGKLWISFDQHTAAN